MTTTFKTAILAAACAILSSSSAEALISVAHLSPEKAKEEFGITLATKNHNPNQTSVTLTFEAKGKLEGFNYVNLDIEIDGKMGVHGPLRVRREGDTVTVRFSTNPAFLEGSSLMIVVSGGVRDHVGYQLAVKDFLP